MLRGTSWSCREGQDRPGRGCSRALNCRQRTGISVRQLVKSTAEVMMCRKAMYRIRLRQLVNSMAEVNDVQEWQCAGITSNTSDCHQASKYSELI